MPRTSKKIVILKKLVVMKQKRIHLKVKIPTKTLLQKGNKLRLWKKIASSKFRKEMIQK